MDKDILDLRRHSRALKKSRWLIAASVLAFALLAYWYWQRNMPEFTIKSVMLIEEEQDNGSGASMSKKGGMAQMMRAFSIGGFGASSVDNERIIAETQTVMLKTIKDLGLNCTYIGSDGMKREILYGDRCPVKVEAPAEYYDTLSVGLKMSIKLHGGKADIKVKKGWFKTIATATGVTLPHDLHTPCGDFRISRVVTPATAGAPSDITVNISGSNALAAHFRKKIELGLYDKKADAIEFKYDDPCSARGKDLLNTLMANYNNTRTEHKDEISRKEIEFYDNRIATLAQDLNNTDNRIVEFKRQNNIVDIETQAGTMVKSDAANRQEAVKLEAELAINEMILGAVRNGTILPPVGDTSTAENIIKYNELVQSRKELERSAKPGNEALVTLNKQIDDAKRAITEGAQKSIEASRIKLSQLNQSTAQEQSKMNAVPSQEKEYFNLLRDKELKNELFIFLMQRRESSMLQLTKNSSPSFVIDKAYSVVKPNIIKPLIICLALLLMGLALPIVWSLWRMKRRDRIADTFDLAPEWERQAFSLHKAKDKDARASTLRQARARLFAMKDANLFYVHDITGGNSEVLGSFVKTIEQAGKTVALLRVKNSDEVYSRDVEKDIAAAKDKDYIFVEIENLPEINEINDRLLDGGAGLMLLLKSGKCTRRRFSELVGETSSTSIVLIN